MKKEDDHMNHDHGECSCENYAGHHWMCGGGMGSWHHGKFMLLRWFLFLIILGMVFLLGLRIGEFKGSVEGDYYGGFRGHRMMMRGYTPYDVWDEYSYPMPGMMQKLPIASPAPSPTPSL